MTMFLLALGVAALAAVRGMWSPCGLSMLTSLNPVAERTRGHRFWATACWYVAGAVAGGALLGGGCAVLAWGWGAAGLGASAAWWVALAAAAAGVVSDLRWLPRSLPDHPRQVDERWLSTYRRWIYAGGYGVQIGCGFATYIMTAAVYLSAALAVLTGAPGRAFAVGVAFGAVRGLLIVCCAGARTPERLRGLLARVDARDGASLRVAAVAQAAVVGVAGCLLGGVLWTAPGVLLALAAGFGPRGVRDGCAIPAGSAPRADDHVHEAHLLQHGRR